MTCIPVLENYVCHSSGQTFAEIQLGNDFVVAAAAAAAAAAHHRPMLKTCCPVGRSFACEMCSLPFFMPAETTAATLLQFLRRRQQ